MIYVRLDLHSPFLYWTGYKSERRPLAPFLSFPVFTMSTVIAAVHEFYRQERLVMHYLEVFRHLRDLPLGGYHAYFNAMAELIDHMVRLVVSFSFNYG